VNNGRSDSQGSGRPFSRRGLHVGAVLAGVTLLSSCRASATTVAATPTTLPSSACSGQASPGNIDIDVASGGIERTVLLHLPTGYGDRDPAALVLNLHGSGSTAAAQMAFSGMNRVADADGFVVAYPQGSITSGSGYDWNVPGQPLFGGGSAPAGAPNDIAFLSTTISTLEAHLCIDPARIYATGFSGGARMVSQLGCDLSTTIAAIAPVSGLRLPSPCAGTRAVPVVSFHGTADPVDPYNGNGQAYWTYSVPDAAARWATHDGCAASPEHTEPVTGAALTEYTACREGAIVDLYTISGEGHEWPGGPTLPAADTAVLGPQSNVLSASATMWRFFTAHPLA
jgi:polyhydroxybutyrate depolymerase